MSSSQERQIALRSVGVTQEFMLLPTVVREAFQTELPASPLDEAVALWASVMQNTNRCVYGAYCNSEIIAICMTVTHLDCWQGGLGTAGFQRGVETGLMTRPGG